MVSSKYCQQDVRTDAGKYIPLQLDGHQLPTVTKRQESPRQLAENFLAKNLRQWCVVKDRDQIHDDHEGE